ncbi:putative LPS assembly protein LptD [Winogradskyella aurantiaca]|uniref:putative LPS assembly protein LptD n=1 Tax=Winogradskyella aurantiaca TaxID=2219558 RepID=UPI000E1CEDBF
MAFQKPSHTFTKIHLKGLLTNKLNILFLLSFTVFINTFSWAQELPKPTPKIEAKVEKDSTVLSGDSLVKTLSPPKEIDSTQQDSIVKKEFLDGPVTYKAEDYTSINQKEEKIYLYNKAEVYYQDMSIKSGVIVIDYANDLVYAGRIKDSTGYSQNPVFVQGQEEISPDSIIFNMKTQKALVYNSRTENSGFNIVAPLTKKENDSVIFMKKGRFTTAENLDDPEYQFVTSKIKVVPNKKIVVGPTYMEIYGVPTPIALPFAYFPLTKSRSSGIIFPTFGEDVANDRGYFLQNGGYYFAINDYVDLAVLGDYYSNGSYGFRLQSNYASRYNFAGNVAVRYEKLINSERGFPDFQESVIYNIRWSHNQDSKANPSSRFSASVNFGSSQFFRQSINQTNQSNFLNNTLASSISYSKSFRGEPQVNLNLSATHSQNTNTGAIDLTLPTLQTSVGRMFPFEPKNGTKKGAIQNINFQYNNNARYSISTNDSIFGTSEMFKDARTGMEHLIPITTNWKVLEHLSMSASTNLREVWTLNTVEQFYDEVNDEEVEIDLNGFDRFFTYNFGTSLGTTLYGMFPFGKDGKDTKIKAIRHVMRPSISYTYTPGFAQYYDTYSFEDPNGDLIEREYTRFEGSIYGQPNRNVSSSIGLSLSNTFEAKVRDKDSTKTEPKKVVILNNFNFTTSYNIAADSLRWAPLRLTGGTQVLNNKMNINFGAIFDPYALDNNNQRVNTFNIDNGGSLFRLVGANLNMSYSLSNETFKGNEESGLDDDERDRSVGANGRADDLFGKSMDFSDNSFSERGENESETDNDFYKFEIPWSLRLQYVINYTNIARENRISSHSLMFSGDIELSPRWSFGFSSGYDFANDGFTYTQFRFGRDLLSWRMDFSWIPFGQNSSWNFFIGIKSNVLKDLKYEQRRQPDRQL